MLEKYVVVTEIFMDALMLLLFKFLNDLISESFNLSTVINKHIAVKYKFGLQIVDTEFYKHVLCKFMNWEGHHFKVYLGIVADQLINWHVFELNP